MVRSASQVAVVAAAATFWLAGCCCCGSGEPLTPEEEARRAEERAAREAAEAEAFVAVEAQSKVHYEGLQAVHAHIDRDEVRGTVSCPDDEIRAVGEDAVGRRTLWTADFDGLPGVSPTSGPWDWLESGAMKAVHELDEKPESIFRDDWIEEIGAPENRHLIVFLAQERAEPGTAAPWFDGTLLVVDLAQPAVICQAPLTVGAAGGPVAEPAVAFETAGNAALETISGELRLSLSR